MNFQRIDACVLAPEVVVRRVDDRTVIAFAGMTFDRLHHGARMKFGMPTRSRSVTSATLVTPMVSKTARARRIVAFGLTERSTPELLYFSSLEPSQNS